MDDGDRGRRVSVRRLLEDGQAADVVGELVEAGDDAVTVRARSGELVTIPRERLLASRIVPDPAREITPAELERIAALGRRGDATRAHWLTTDVVTIRARVPAHAGVHVAEEVTPAGVTFAVASFVDNGELQASAHGALARHWLGVSALWVAPAARRQGLAAATVGALARWAGNARARHVYAVVDDGDVPALALAARLGFAPHHTAGLSPP